MPKLEVTRKSELSRKEVADRLIALGRALASGSEVELGSGGDSIKIEVAEQVQWELEIEVDGDETEIELEIKWRDNPPSDELEAAAQSEPETAMPAKTARRGRPHKSTAK
ncbi:MAG TPA: amphi-Trp domain-containing protein [Aldersonia sp.]